MNDIALAIRGNKATLCVTSHTPREARQYLLLLLLLHVLDRGRRLEDPSNPTKSTCKVHQAWTLRLWDSTVSHQHQRCWWWWWWWWWPTAAPRSGAILPLHRRMLICSEEVTCSPRVLLVRTVPRIGWMDGSTLLCSTVMAEPSI